MRYLIIDDDADFAEILKRKLEASPLFRKDMDTADIETAAGTQAEAAAKNADVLFADIVLEDGGGNGMDFVKKVNEANPDCTVIYVTSYLKYATEVYDTRHAYFIYKPELDKRLDKALRRALEQRAAEPKKYTIFFNGHTTVVNCPDIVYIEQHGRLSYIVCASGTQQTYKKLDAVMEELGGGEFYRCHKSFAVNLSHVRTYERDAFIMDTGAEVKISRAHVDEARAAFAAWSVRRD